MWATSMSVVEKVVKRKRIDFPEGELVRVLYREVLSLFAGDR